MIFTFVLYIRVSRKSENTTKLMMMWTFVEKLQGLLLQHWHININIHNNNYNNNKYIMRMVNGEWDELQEWNPCASFSVCLLHREKWMKEMVSWLPSQEDIDCFCFFLFCISTWRRNHHIISYHCYSKTYYTSIQLFFITISTVSN